MAFIVDNEKPELFAKDAMTEPFDGDRLQRVVGVTMASSLAAGTGAEICTMQ